MELATAVTMDPFLWSILWVLVQNILVLIQNSPDDRITVVRFVQGKVMDVKRLLERMERNPNFGVDATITSNLQFALEALKMELTRVLKLNGVMYSMQAKRCKDSLAERVGHVDSVLTSLNTELLLSLRDQQEVVERTRLQEETARLTVANERLLRQVSAGGPRRDEVLAGRTMQHCIQESSERVGSLVPYIIPDATVPLAEENAGLVAYCKGQGKIAFAECLGTVPMPACSPMTTTACVSFQESDLGLEQGREAAYAAVVSIDEASSGLGSPVAFIHRDHKCDGCLTKPIVGKKFHSLHVPNYDLCEECYKRCDGTSDDFWEE